MWFIKFTAAMEI